jgi:dolichol kinase
MLDMILSTLWTLLSVGVVLAILYLAEKGSRAKHLHPELTRKFVHVTVGSFVAFWPFYLSWREIATLSLAFLLVIALSARFDIFRSIHSVKRNTTGEFLFALSIGVVSIISSNKWVFMAAMLNLALADGMAALVGILKGEGNEYKVFGHTKSRAGTTAFLITSFAISIIYLIFSHSHIGITTLVIVPVVATVSENLAINGTDNLVIPVIVALILSGSL